jgi:hypothetical protein
VHKISVCILNQWLSKFYSSEVYILRNYSELPRALVYMCFYIIYTTIENKIIQNGQIYKVFIQKLIHWMAYI